MLTARCPPIRRHSRATDIAGSAFLRELRARQPDPTGRRWVYLPYDQLSERIGPLAAEASTSIGIVLIESRWKAARRPYHKQKLALVLANQRHFALEQAGRGVAVRYLTTDRPYAEALRGLPPELGPLRVMEPAERELRDDLAPLVAAGKLEVEPHAGWLTTPAQFREGAGADPPWRMDAFYRHVRRTTGTLMDGTKPVGGKFSFDAENRRAWKGEPPAPEPPTFAPDAVTREVADLVEHRFADHPGRVVLDALPATHTDAERLWQWALDACLPTFGPYEDAMSVRSRGLFHTRIAPLLNLHRLLPRRVVDDVAALGIPMASKEGFIRQVLGWREFVRHVHRETDGFAPVGERTTDASHRRSAVPPFLDADWPLPDAYWGTPSGLHCLDTVVRDVWDEAYSHHITRLMVLANIATLLGVRPRELTDWFWVAYADAYDWVVEPNVLGMGTYALGDLMITKPYVSGAGYIDRMSDYCAECAFHPKKTCPLTPMYWQFLDRHREALAGNPRIAIPLRAVAKRSAAQRRRDAAVLAAVRERLATGARVALSDLPPPVA